MSLDTNAMTSFKVYIGDEIRRFSLVDPSYGMFLQKLANIHSFQKEMKTIYEDGDKEKVVFSSEVEFHEMMCHLRSIQKGEVTIRIWIQEVNVPCHKDGTQPLPLSDTEKHASGDQSEDIWFYLGKVASTITHTCSTIAQFLKTFGNYAQSTMSSCAEEFTELFGDIFDEDKIHAHIQIVYKIIIEILFGHFTSFNMEKNAQNEPVYREHPTSQEPEKTEVVDPSSEESHQPQHQADEANKWREEIRILREMGFRFEDSVLIFMLDQHKGDIGLTVQSLLV